MAASSMKLMKIWKAPMFNPLQPGVDFLYPRKTSEYLWVFLMFPGVIYKQYIRCYKAIYTMLRVVQDLFPILLFNFNENYVFKSLFYKSSLTFFSKPKILCINNYYYEPKNILFFRLALLIKNIWIKLKNAQQIFALIVVLISRKHFYETFPLCWRLLSF